MRTFRLTGILLKKPLSSSLTGTMYDSHFIGADKLTGITGFISSVEDYAGNVQCGGFNVFVCNSPKLDPTIASWFHDRIGGFLYGLEQNDVVTCDVYASYKESIFTLDKGVLYTWNVDVVNDIIQITCNSGIARLNRFDDLTDLKDSGAPYLGRSLQQIITEDIRNLVQLPEENIVYSISDLESADRFWSYAQAPEPRWAETFNTYPNPITPMPTDRCFSIAYGNGEIFTVIDRWLLGYTINTKVWREILNISTVSGLTFYNTPTGLRVEDMVYIAGTPNKLWLAVRPVYYLPSGDSRRLDHYKYYKVEVTL
jgi:hypothetical protein